MKKKTEQKSKRKLGIASKKGTVSWVGDGKITIEDFFGVESLDDLPKL